MSKQTKTVISALALLAFISIIRPIIEYAFPEMPANYAILLRKALQALTVIIFITATKIWSQIGSLGKISKKSLLPLLPVIILSFSSYLFGLKDYNFEEYLITFLICILIGVIEELSLRGIMYNAMRPYGASTAVIVSSAVFGLVHIPNMFYNKDIEGTLFQVLFAFGFGLVMAFVRYKTDLLLPQLLVHALWDFNVKISNTSLTIAFADTMNIISEILVVLFGLFLMICVLKENKSDSRLIIDKNI